MQYKQNLNCLLAGMTLFVATIYIAPLNTAIFAGTGINGEALFLGTLAVLTVSTALNASYSGVGFALAPAVGISIFLSTYIVGSGIRWEYALIACSISGLLIFFASCFDERTKLLDAIPFDIRLSAKSAVGTLLVKSAYQAVEQDSLNIGLDESIKVFAIGSLIIIFCLWLSAALEKKLAGASAKTSIVLEILDVVAKAGFILSIVVCFYLLSTGENLSIVPASGDRTFWLWGNADLSSHASFQQLMLAVPIIITVSFVLLTDIPGTPYELLPDDFTVEMGGKVIKKEEIYRRAFRVDGLAAAFAPLGSTPPVFYAENYVLRIYSIYGQSVGYVFALMGALTIALILLFPDLRITQLVFNVPDLAFAPLIATVGVVMIADAIRSAHARRSASPETGETGSLVHFVPVTFTALTTPILGIEISFPLSFLVYLLFASETDKKLSLDTDRKAFRFKGLAILGVVSAMIASAAKFLT